ncbi:MAG: thiol oxidoreductase [Chloroflexi bacterium AL-W]|nr:thiol oxidoreductase [Chloroflexi bacterium AL-N1]NOK67950.1 thiol oxidoreductase [Chloroflexi bacterium AL-N10]NOK73290.1 thiol oxidoreductase [Chloroflexi bacterium AL-N5]NOK83204.1 thiol oxidoreductase [Chloroflexi bacterium AL-W]NOK87621.1 thiol oxidoreductase [Chloroflexi bacterium AL-N15]
MSLSRTRRTTRLFSLLLVTTVIVTGCSQQPARQQPTVEVGQEAADISNPTSDATPLLEEGEELSGGQATVFDTTRNAFAHPAPGLERQDELFFFVGNSFFNQNWVTAPASTTARDGLGPFFNSRSCAGCHFLDGRGRPPEQFGEVSTGFLMRLSIPGETLYHAPITEPNYGEQLQNQSIEDVPTEGEIRITYEEIEGEFADGTSYTLQKPIYTPVDLAYGELHPETMFSPRVANQMIGLGLLEAIPEQTLLEMADPTDQDGDGISGRPNYVYDVYNDQLAIGRFGWKANQPHLLQQVASAFLGDIGITTGLFPDQNCSDFEVECSDAFAGDETEIADDDLLKVVLYSSSLAVPARRDWDDETVLQGKQLFFEVGCVSCHVSWLETGVHPTIPALSHQTIYPYTDLLLHDMGPYLADGRPDFQATGSEWRTPPLWGIGLFETVNGHTNYLHDGRARNLMEAVLWHGGEAEAAKNNVLNFDEAQRDALIAFLESL